MRWSGHGLIWSTGICLEVQESRENQAKLSLWAKILIQNPCNTKQEYTHSTMMFDDKHVDSLSVYGQCQDAAAALWRTSL
jgi:hypothetical protein